MSIDRSSPPRVWPATAAFVVCLVLAAPVPAWQNVLQDPGFERYHYDANLGYYVPDANAAWQEYGFGQASVRYDFSGWTAPAEMSAERPLGFTPGAGGFEGYGATDNKGVLGCMSGPGIALDPDCGEE